MLSNHHTSNQCITIEEAIKSGQKLKTHYLPEQEIIFIDKGFSMIATIAKIEKIINSIQENCEPAFEIYKTPTGHTQLKVNAIGRMFQLLARMPSKKIFNHVLANKKISPSIELLFSLLDGQEWRYVNPSYVMFDGRCAALHFNDFIERFRVGMRQPDHQKKIACWHGYASKNYKGAVKYLFRVLNKYKRLRIVRLDLSYQLNSIERFDEVLCRKHFKRFIANQRHKRRLFKHVVGYIWRLEYGKEMGYHFHWILMFDGNHILKEEWYADQIGRYWREEITAGSGSYYNCNHAARINKFKSKPQYGLGELKLSDRQKLDATCAHVIGYLTKIDILMKSVNCNGKTFGKGLVR